MQLAQSSAEQILTVFGGHVAERHADQTESNLFREHSAAGVAFVWLAFYVVIGLAAVAHHGARLV